MNRDEVKQVLGENASDEVVTNLLNLFHNAGKSKDEEITRLNNQMSDYGELKNKVDQMENEKLTQQQRIDKMEKEAEENLRASKLTRNKADVMTVLAGLDIDEDIINQIVCEDNQKSLDLANKLLNKFNLTKENVEKKVKEDLMNTNINPSLPTTKQDDDVMTLDKFKKLSFAEAKKWKDNNLDKYHEWYPVKIK